MSRPTPPARSSRLAITASIVVLAAVVVGFGWFAIASFRFIHGTDRFGTLKPVKVTGPEEVVFRWQRDRCEDVDVPDSPARAFRDARGQVHLLASHYIVRQAVGPDLNRVRHRCAVVLRSPNDPDPSRFTGKEWIFSPYTRDGTNLLALVHDEYHGSEFSGRCPSGQFFPCWYAAITLVRSTDGGNTFRPARPPPGHLVAEVPYRYVPGQGPSGITQPSNIVFKDGYYYALVAPKRYRAQDSGACLMRTNRLEDPAAWRAWGGTDFDVTFVDPYRARSAAGEHICSPVAPDQIADMTMSLTYNTYFGKYLLVGPARAHDLRRRRVVSGFYYSLSDDLIHWSPRKLIVEAELLQTYRCGDRDPLYYPSVLDPSSKSRNFDTTGRRPYMYFTRLHYEACRQTLDRDLVRVPIEFSK